MENESKSVDKSRDFGDFVSARTAAQHWDAARRLMAAKKLHSAFAEESFGLAFDSLATIIQSGEGLEKLLSVDLIIRIAAATKTLQRRAATLLKVALACPLPPAWIVSDTAVLPTGAKAAEVRENIAQALSYASGEWVTPYAVQFLAREDRSQRCRVELCRRLIAQIPQLGEWLRELTREAWQDILPDSNASDGRVVRLRDLTAAIAEVISTNRTRIAIVPEDGAIFAALTRGVARFPTREIPGQRLVAAACQVVRLLDEMIAAEFTLATEPEAYEVLEVLQSRWRPHPFQTELLNELETIERRLRSAITWRARMGQRSESLVLRLRQALGPGSLPAEILVSIADSNLGLPSDIDDWVKRACQGG